MPAHTTRLSLPYPLSTEAPDGPAQIAALATAIDAAVIYGQGVLASRPVSTGGSPGIQGRVYVVEGDSTAKNNGVVWWDTGTSWIAVGTTNISGLGAVATTITGLNALFPSSTPYDGARGKLLLTGGAAGQVAHVVDVIYEASISKWVTARVWEAIQTVSPVTITGAEADFTASYSNYGWIENYSDLYAAGLRPQSWIAGQIVNGGFGQVRINYNIRTFDSGDAALATAVANTSAGAAATPATPVFVSQGWTDAVGVTAPTSRHGAIVLRGSNDGGGANTATFYVCSVKIRMVA